MLCFSALSLLSGCPEDQAGTGRTLYVPPVTRGSRGNLFFFSCHSADFLPYFLPFGLFLCLGYIVETTGRGISNRATPSVKSTTPDRQTYRITSAPTSVNRVVCARTQVYSDPAKRHHRNPVRLPFVHSVRLPLHGSLLTRLALLAQFVGFRLPHYCSSLLSYQRHEAIKENGRNKDGNPRPVTQEHPTARGNGQTAK